MLWRTEKNDNVLRFVENLEMLSAYICMLSRFHMRCGFRAKITSAIIHLDPSTLGSEFYLTNRYTNTQSYALLA